MGNPMARPVDAKKIYIGGDVDKSGQTRTGVASLLPPRIEGVRTPRAAAMDTVKRCNSEQDAIAVSVALSHLTYREIAARMGVSKTLVNDMAKGKRPLTAKRTQAFCNATGTSLVMQYRDMERALRQVEGRQRERDRIAAMAFATEQVWEQAA